MGTKRPREKTAKSARPPKPVLRTDELGLLPEIISDGFRAGNIFPFAFCDSYPFAFRSISRPSRYSAAGAHPSIGRSRARRSNAVTLCVLIT